MDQTNPFKIKMELIPPIVIYSHSSYADVWPLILGQFKKFLINNKIYLFTDADPLGGDYNVIFYDENLSYNERMISCLEQINEPIILFTHEDMPLYDAPDITQLNKYYSYIEQGLADSIKLIFAGWHLKSKTQDFDVTLSKNKLSRFSVQPTLMNKMALIKILKKHPAKNLWKLERKIEKSWFYSFNELCCNLMGEKRGNHFDCPIYPYIATAIVKGDWNLQQYPFLSDMLDNYNIKSRNYD